MSPPNPVAWGGDCGGYTLQVGIRKVSHAAVMNERKGNETSALFRLDLHCYSGFLRTPYRNEEAVERGVL